MTRMVILLHPQDNVVVCCRDIAAGADVSAAGFEFLVGQSVQLGHKLAVRDLEPGDKIIKYGTSIGSATAQIRVGDWVHTHNMTSDYISPHTRQTEGSNA